MIEGDEKKGAAAPADPEQGAEDTMETQ